MNKTTAIIYALLAAIHNHYLTDNKHDHHHTIRELEQLPGALHR